MKNHKLFCAIILVQTIATNMAWCQGTFQDSLVNESLKDCLSRIRNVSECVIETNTFPNGWTIPDWCRDKGVDFNFYNPKVQRKLKTTREGVRTISFDWDLMENGEFVVIIKLSLIKIKRRVRFQYLSDCYSYHWKYSEIERKWILIQKRGVGI